MYWWLHSALARGSIGKDCKLRRG
ncbi:Protein of unknown function [Pyronema omphalodes CBS 100304]|uniref:Uncharacterized protein n=1 Tax=Pyronema omphalodes (strain CBS 100304) TaxID=1076935 RepID=U4L5G7_PYROM|nr:Protein of unknown function [Pyronema omphalodes CBS 100304]